MKNQTITELCDEYLIQIDTYREKFRNTFGFSPVDPFEFNSFLPSDQDKLNRMFWLEPEMRKLQCLRELFVEIRARRLFDKEEPNGNK
jgi:hypothetical protein